MEIRPVARPGNTVTALLLAGGAGRRMGGIDKGLMPYRGRPMIEWVLDATRPQVDTLFISANRNHERYAGYGHPVIPDIRPGFAGPLAGLEAGLIAVQTPWLLMLPGDAPALPPNLVQRLQQRQLDAGARVVMVQTAAGPLPICALVHRDLLADLQAWLERGERRALAWMQRHEPALVDYSQLPASSWSINTPAELAALQEHAA